MIFLEYYSRGESHSEINAAMIAILLQKYPCEQFYLFCSKGHFKCIESILKKSDINITNVIFNEISVSPEKFEYSRFFIDFNLIKQIFNFAKTSEETKIFVSYTTTLFLYYLKLFLFFNPKIKVITAIHSELERLYVWKYAQGFSGIKKYVTALYCFVFSLFLPLCIYVKNYKCLVYGESIKNNLLKKVPFISKESVIVIDHPYVTQEKINPVPFNKPEIQFGIIGLIDKKKNGINLKMLLQKLKEKECKNFKISLIGHIRNRITEEYLLDVLNLDFVEYKRKVNEFISKELRDSLEEQTDYNIYTYNSDGYKLTASGAFMDAVNFEKPIIAIKNDFFEYYFNKYGNIGYLCDSIDDMVEIILQIVNKPPKDEYIIQQKNIKILKREIDINYIAQNIALNF